MILDLVLKILGEHPAIYPNTSDKWAVILAYITDLIVPFGQIVVFIIPLAVILFWKKLKFSPRNVILAVIVGGLLAWGAWWLDWWILALGQASVFNAIYGN